MGDDGKLRKEGEQPTTFKPILVVGVDNLNRLIIQGPKDKKLVLSILADSIKLVANSEAVESKIIRPF